ncbi:TPA: hypothetical protein EYP66_20880 [Candidatus Poribacteria bacterium]|nr:hypothetical protein [Candidatus Poribacteria bacterium]
MNLILLGEFESVGFASASLDDGAMMRAMNFALDSVKAAFGFDFNFDGLYGDVPSFAIVAILQRIIGIDFLNSMNRIVNVCIEFLLPSLRLRSGQALHDFLVLIHTKRLTVQ